MMSLNRGFWLTAAVTAVMAMGCGETGPGTDAGSGCSTDANCGTGRVCHPVLKRCESSCTGASDCPASAKTCARLDSTAVSATTPGFCQCATDALCNGGTAGSLVCSNQTKLCTNKCTANSQCLQGATCDTATGQCTGGGTDAGTDAGVTDAGTDAGVSACTSTNTQPDTCLYGSVCTAANTCEAIADGTCANVMGRAAWTSASTGPVIFNVVSETSDPAGCTANNAFTLTLYAYAGPGMTFPAQKSNLPGFFYYTANGNTVDIPTNLLTQGNYTLFSNGAVMGAKFTLCSTNASQLVAGFGFTNGNGYCATLTR